MFLTWNGSFGEGRIGVCGVHQGVFFKLLLLIRSVSCSLDPVCLSVCLSVNVLFSSCCCCCCSTTATAAAAAHSAKGKERGGRSIERMIIIIITADPETIWCSATARLCLHVAPLVDLHSTWRICSTGRGPTRFLISAAMVMNACSTLVAFFADVSRNGMPN